MPEGFRLPAIVGALEDRGRVASELLSPGELAKEGEEMHHCVGSYWPECIAGDRIFALRLADGERATAQYHPIVGGDAGDDPRYRLVQLRGPCNRKPSAAMFAWARTVAALLNVPSRRKARRAALEALDRVEMARTAARLSCSGLDDRSERQLERALEWLDYKPLAPGTVLCAYVAGYQYHAGPALEQRLAVGEPLTLVREQDNPHDAMAVRIDWQGEKIGYVPRTANADIARRLEAGENLAARIAEIDLQAEPWERVAFVIESAGE